MRSFLFACLLFMVSRVRGQTCPTPNPDTLPTSYEAYSYNTFTWYNLVNNKCTPTTYSVYIGSYCPQTGTYLSNNQKYTVKDCSDACDNSNDCFAFAFRYGGSYHYCRLYTETDCHNDDNGQLDIRTGKNYWGTGYEWGPITDLHIKCPHGAKSSQEHPTVCESVSTCPPGEGGDPCQPCAAGERGVNGQCSACGAGFFSASTNSSTCTACSPGTYQDQGSQTSCKDCATGTYQDQTGQTSCSACPQDKPNSALGSDALGDCSSCPNVADFMDSNEQCVSCPTGWAFSSDQCVENCPSGHKRPSNNYCQSCEAGRFAAGTDPSTCTLCAAGQFQDDAGQASCEACGANTYASGEGNTACTNCITNATSPISSTSELNCSCSAGTGGQQGACTTCIAGQYGDGTSINPCKLCAAGTFQSVTGQSACSICPAGTYQSEEGTSSCTACETGKTSEPGSTSEDDCGCAPGYKGVTPQITVTKNALCFIANFSDCDNDDSTFKFTFKNIRSVGDQGYPPWIQFKCNSDDNMHIKYRYATWGGRDDYYTDDYDDNNPDYKPIIQDTPIMYGMAQERSDNEWKNGEKICLSFGLVPNILNNPQILFESTFNNSYVTSVKAKLCVRGSYTFDYDMIPSISSMPACDVENDPDYTFDSTQSERIIYPSEICKACNPGTYQDLAGKTVCKNCPYGFYQSEAAQENCDACGKSFVEALTSNDTCIDECPSDAITVNNRCETCELGQHTSSTVCVDCPVGWASNSVSENCTICAAGTFSSEPKSTSCTACAAGKTSLAGGSVCGCATGRYNSNGACTACASGLYSDVIDATECKSCPDGYQTIPDDRTECTACPAGKMHSDNSCLTCASGRYQDQEGQITCKTCPDGYQMIPENRTDCKACPAGKMHNVINFDQTFYV